MIPAERRKQRQPLDRELPEETTVLVERYLQEFPARFLTEEHERDIAQRVSGNSHPDIGLVAAEFCLRRFCDRC